MNPAKQVEVLTAADADRLAPLAADSGISLVISLGNGPAGRFALHFVDDQLTLKDQEKGSFTLDFISDRTHYARRSILGKNELLARALGSRQGLTRVVDLTAGLGQDAIFLLRLGFQVLAIERNPWIYLLLADAHRRSLLSPEKELFGGIEFHFGEAMTWLDERHKLAAWSPEQAAIYLDPMYPETKKSALPRKEMQIFRDLVGTDEDSLTLLQRSLAEGYRRVAVKRPFEGPPLAAGFQHQYKGATVRYDLYVGGMQ